MKLHLIERYLQTLLMPMWLRRILVYRARQEAVSKADVMHSEEVRKLYLDLSVIAQHDAGTGIQRLVRSVATTFAAESPHGWQVLFCAATHCKGYRQIAWPEKTGAESELPWSAGDVFLGLDFALDTIPRDRRDLLRMKQQGAHFWFVMYDLLPQKMPDWFSDKLVVRYRRWLQTICEIADGFFCISPAVTQEMREYLSQDLGLPQRLMPALVTLPMGWDISHAPHSQGISPEVEALLKDIQEKELPTALMVGTLEPRKGHADVLAAFECLWEQGRNSRLVIAGRPGWKTEALQLTLRKHKDQGMPVQWIDDATDEEIERLYAACSGVIVASHGEGFGLPLLEALGHDKPVLARDIPVFHTIDAAAISYFPAEVTDLQLAGHIERWISPSRATAVTSSPLALPSWTDTVAAITFGLEEHTKFQMRVNT